MRLNQLVKKLQRKKPTEFERRNAEISRIVQQRIDGPFPCPYPYKEPLYKKVMNYVKNLRKKNKPLDLDFAPSPIEHLHIPPEKVSKAIEYTSRIVQQRMSFYTW